MLEFRGLCLKSCQLQELKIEIFRALRGPTQSSEEKEKNRESTSGNMAVFLNHLGNCRQAEEDIESFFRRKRPGIIGTSSNLESHV